MTCAQECLDSGDRLVLVNSNPLTPDLGKWVVKWLREGQLGGKEGASLGHH